MIFGIPMLIIALFIWIEDRGPALFLQSRVGKGGRVFTIYKFRSMPFKPEAPVMQQVPQTWEEKKAARMNFQTTRDNDPRITRVGRILRPSHLDEVPQLLNVLIGDMSIVGVRPDTPVQEVDYSPKFWLERHRLRPGITGPAQIKSNTANLDERSMLEMTWIGAPSYRSYIAIIFATIAKVIRRTGN